MHQYSWIGVIIGRRNPGSTATAILDRLVAGELEYAKNARDFLRAFLSFYGWRIGNSWSWIGDDQERSISLGRLIVFNSISLDGFFVDRNGDMGWAHNPNKDEEWDAFVASKASGGGALLFGRKTYDLMVSYWPTPLAAQNDPVVAEKMNGFQKVVFSRTLDKISWMNSRLVKEGLVLEIQKMKNEAGTDFVILGSGSIISQLTRERLVDEYQVVVIPVLLGSGRTMFEGIKEKIPLELRGTHRFNNGNVFLTYVPVA